MGDNASYINLERIMHTINESSKIGTLSAGGLCRLALSDADKQMRDLFKSWMEEEGLEVRIDDMGNMYGRREGRNKEAAAILIGSHLDTQTEGGNYDGILGVLASLEVIRTLNEHQIVTERPIEIVNFTNEEGARFEPPMVGSGVLANVFSKEYVLHLTDKEGRVFGEELERIGYRGEKQNRAYHVHRFIELHIEQGPVLEQNKIAIGAVEGIQGMTWLEVTIRGKTSHAGTTPMGMRKDALGAAAKIIKMLNESIHEMNPDILLTMGRFSVTPGTVNSIPGEVVFSVDVRHFEDLIRDHAVEVVREKISTITALEGFEVEIKKIWESNATQFSSDIIELIEEAANAHGYTTQRMVSGAGHDSKYMREIVPTGMIFVPSIGGKSHCQDEYTLPEDIEKGANVLLYVVRSLANA
ncbi:Zn-dependent hydrolase [Aneurinibacillus sp. REN35]|uniref:Zn-dependent hydrolase n=1 Tax=Aneurinibacillus sp. REN35 TaxID=3237286 RepID=UPI003526C888